MDAMGAEERKSFATAREDLTQGTAGNQEAIGTLREYYALSLLRGNPMHQMCRPSITKLLLLIESDCSTNVAELSRSETDAESSSQKSTRGKGCRMRAPAGGERRGFQKQTSQSHRQLMTWVSLSSVWQATVRSEMEVEDEEMPPLVKKKKRASKCFFFSFSAKFQCCVARWHDHVPRVFFFV